MSGWGLFVDENKQLEQATAEGFLRLFNSRFGANYEIVKLQDAPDVKCQDSNGTALNLEITLTENRNRDIKAALGRSEHRNAESFDPTTSGSCLQNDVRKQTVERIRKKLLKRYGPDTALVVRDTSGTDWDWSLVVDELKTELGSVRNPFDKGIWILNRSKTRLCRLL